MTHPDLFLSPAPTIESPIYWQKTAVELKELITALDVDNAFGDVSSERIPFSEVVSCFEQFLHVKLGKATEVKRTIFDRKFSLSVYLESLAAKINQTKNPAQK